MHIPGFAHRSGAFFCQKKKHNFLFLQILPDRSDKRVAVQQARQAGKAGISISARQNDKRSLLTGDGGLRYPSSMGDDKTHISKTKFPNVSYVLLYTALHTHTSVHSFFHFPFSSDVRTWP